MIFYSLPREGWGGLNKTFRTRGSLEAGWFLEERAEMLSERSEFISAFQETASRPPSQDVFGFFFCFFIFFPTEEEKKETFGSFRKELFFKTEEEMNKTFGSFTKEQKKEMNKKGAF